MRSAVLSSDFRTTQQTIDATLHAVTIAGLFIDSNSLLVSNTEEMDEPSKIATPQASKQASQPPFVNQSTLLSLSLQPTSLLYYLGKQRINP